MGTGRIGGAAGASPASGDDANLAAPRAGAAASAAGAAVQTTAAAVGSSSEQTGDGTANGKASTLADFAGFTGIAAYLGLCGYCYAAEDAGARVTTYGLPQLFLSLDPRSAILPAAAALTPMAVAVVAALALRHSDWRSVSAWTSIAAVAVIFSWHWIGNPAEYTFSRASVAGLVVLVGLSVIARRGRGGFARFMAGHGRRKSRESAVAVVILLVGLAFAGYLGKAVGTRFATRDVDLPITSDRSLCPSQVSQAGQLCAVVGFNGTEVAGRWISVATGRLGSGLLLSQVPGTGVPEQVERFAVVGAPSVPSATAAASALDPVHRGGIDG